MAHRRDWLDIIHEQEMSREERGVEDQAEDEYHKRICCPSQSMGDWDLDYEWDQSQKEAEYWDKVFGTKP